MSNEKMARVSMSDFETVPTGTTAELEKLRNERDDLLDRLGRISDVWDSCLGWPDTSDDKIRLGEVIRRYEK